MRVLGVLVVLFCTCKPASKTLSQDDNLLRKIVGQEIGENATITKNNSKTFALGVVTNDESVRYVVIRLSDNKVVVKNNIRGVISWRADMELNESRTPGIVKKDSRSDDYSRTIDLKQFIAHSK